MDDKLNENGKLVCMMATKRNPTKELRWLIAETLIGWAINVAPDDDGRIELAEFLSVWVPAQMRRAK